MSFNEWQRIDTDKWLWWWEQTPWNGHNGDYQCIYRSGEVLLLLAVNPLHPSGQFNGTSISEYRGTVTDEAFPIGDPTSGVPQPAFIRQIDCPEIEGTPVTDLDPVWARAQQYIDQLTS